MPTINQIELADADRGEKWEYAAPGVITEAQLGVKCHRVVGEPMVGADGCIVFRCPVCRAFPAEMILLVPPESPV